MTDILITRDYRSPPTLLWRAMTEPDLVARWTTTGRGGRPEGFEPRVGARFRFIGKPVPGWDGIVRCEVLEVRVPQILRFSWQGSEGEQPTEVSYLIEPLNDGSRLTYRHTGFTGLSGQLMSRLLRRVRRKMLDHALPGVLAELTTTHTQPTSELSPPRA